MIETFLILIQGALSGIAAHYSLTKKNKAIAIMAGIIALVFLGCWIASGHKCLYSIGLWFQLLIIVIAKDA